MKGRVEVDTDLCKGCGLCVYFCPKSVLDLTGEVNSKGYRTAKKGNPASCTGCAICAHVCPDIALVVWRGKDSREAI